ncbi:MAG: family 10 glycosylhydrolase [Treponema sp.]|nr:family 10 glycosylhydrolase [Treponema sp.]
MKYVLLCTCTMLILFSGCMITRQIEEIPEEVQPPATELRGVWFSYFDWDALPKEESSFKEAVQTLVDTVKNNGLNAIFLHVHSHSDSYYLKSTYFPMSKYASGAIGIQTSYDPLEIIIQIAHAKGIQIHAWINPYRIGSVSLFDELPDDSIVPLWWKSDTHHRNVLFHKNQYYLNPSSQQVQAYLVATITELCQNYDIDGVQFDDYFYPLINDNDPALSFDKTDYEQSGSTKSLTQWRRDAVSTFIQQVHTAVHNEKPDCLFGISPVGNISNLRSTQQYLTDIDTWLSDASHIDYIMPQIYWGFEPRLGNGEVAPWAFENCLEQWKALTNESPVALYAGLALYHAGTNVKDGNSTSEWISYSNIIARQIAICQSDTQVQGFSLFDYRDMFKDSAAQEMENIRTLLCTEQ